MAYTVLQYTNLCLTRAGIIQSDLSALTSNSQQQDVDAMLGSINEVVDELYFIAGSVKPAVLQASSTLTLVTSTRTYAVASGFVELADPIMVDQTHGTVLLPYPGGFEQMSHDQLIPSANTGMPAYYAIDPTTGNFYLDTIPAAAQAGRVYTYRYAVETNYLNSAPTSTFPFVDELMRNAIPAVVMAFNRERRPDNFSQKQYDRRLSVAAALLPRQRKGRTYGPDAR